MNSTESTPQISIVIPCYNHGQYIDDAISSVEEIGDKVRYEIIIVNDGSTDEYTNTHLNELAQKGYNVVTQQNKGLAATRNIGIDLAKGKYILPLDADNRITPEYVYESVEIFESNPDISVVYSDAFLFGETDKDVLMAGPFNLQRLMLSNYIDACAIFRKDVWEAVDGYDGDTTAIIPGLEDWEFWLHAAFKGYKFHYIPKKLYYYRVLKNSMIHNVKKKKYGSVKVIDYMARKHEYFFGPQHIDNDIMMKFEQSLPGFLGKIFLKRYFPKKFESLVIKGKFRKYI